MVKQHLKRLASPRTWPIAKKLSVFVARPNPGPHKMEHHIPVSVFLRDMVAFVKTTKEVKRLLHLKKVFVDGRVIHDEKRPVGLLDVVSIPEANIYYRILISKKNKLYALPISEEEAKSKLTKLVGKTHLKGGKVQLNTFDGRSILVDDDKKHSLGSSLIISIPEQEIKTVLPMEKGALVFLEAGSHVGKVGVLESIDGTTITVKLDDKIFQTKRRYAIVIGKDKPIITLEE
jgi:small subunit ribosomal protein S4e